MLLRLSEAAVSTSYLLPLVAPFIGRAATSPWGRGRGGAGGGWGGGEDGYVHHLDVLDGRDFCFQSRNLRVKRVSIGG